MSELLFLLMLVDLVLGSGNGRKSRVKIMVSHIGQAVRSSSPTSRNKDIILYELNTIGEINGHRGEHKADI